MMKMKSFFKDRKILVTGHTGFIGSWLTKWLILYGSKICGYALEPPSVPSLYKSINLENSISGVRGDIKDRKLLRKTIQNFQPEIVFHLAAQPIVLNSYEIPVDTFDTNVTGTVNLLNELRQINSVKTIIVMTSDKSYRNNEWVYPYRENDELGGKDPYSASKSCQDIVVDSFRESYFSDSGVGIASIRAGNVIGGGDWAPLRIVPDLVRGIVNDEMIRIRNPNSVRPWQHVLEPISGMIKLSERIYSDNKFSGAWNFGPEHKTEITVKDLTEKFIEIWGKGKYEVIKSETNKESSYLQLDINKAKKKLNWSPRYNFDETLRETITWYKEYYKAHNKITDETRNQIERYCLDLNS